VKPHPIQHGLYRLVEGMRQLFAVATLGVLLLIQPLRHSAAQVADGLRAEPDRIVRTVSYSSREFASGHSGADVKRSRRGEQS
jgi:hypothetical protein